METTLEMALGENIKKYRQLSGLKQTQVAESIGVSKGAISQYENNIVKPSTENLISMAKLFKVSTDELLSEAESDDYPGSDDPKRPYHTPYNAQHRDKGGRDNMWFVPAKAQAGFIKGFQDRIFSHQIQRISFPLINGECFLFEIEGFSMYPDYTPGSYVVSTLIEEGLDWLRPKQAYVFQTPGGIAIKFFEGYSDTEVFISAANNNYNPVRPMLREELQAVYNIEFRMDKPPRN